MTTLAGPAAPASGALSLRMPAAEALANQLAETRPLAGLQAIDELLRDRGAILERIRRDIDLAGLARALLVTIALASAIFGATLGTYRGGIQILYAAIKLPLLLLLTAAVCAPALTAFNAALDRPTSLRRDIALVLGALALGSLLLVAQAPVIFLAALAHASYHMTILLTFTCSAVAGLASLFFLARGMRVASHERATSAVLALVLVFSVIGAQMAWTLRPYLVRPRTPDVPFLRALEGNLLESVGESFDSARGIYHRDRAPLPGDEPSMQPDDQTLWEEGTPEGSDDQTLREEAAPERTWP